MIHRLKWTTIGHPGKSRKLSETHTKLTPAACVQFAADLMRHGHKWHKCAEINPALVRKRAQTPSPCSMHYQQNHLDMEWVKIAPQNGRAFYGLLVRMTKHQTNLVVPWVWNQPLHGPDHRDSYCSQMSQEQCSARRTSKAVKNEALPVLKDMPVVSSHDWRQLSLCQLSVGPALIHRQVFILTSCLNFMQIWAIDTLHISSLVAMTDALFSAGTHHDASDLPSGSIYTRFGDWELVIVVRLIPSRVGRWWSCTWMGQAKWCIQTGLLGPGFDDPLTDLSPLATFETKTVFRIHPSMGGGWWRVVHDQLR